MERTLSPKRTQPGKPLEVKCPQCGRPTPWADNPFRPFCSERCKTVDLAAWANGEYAIPIATDSNEEPEE